MALDIIGSFFSNDTANGVGGALLDAFRSLCYTLDEVLYKWIIFLYDLFLTLCNGKILDTEIVNSLTKRIGLILGVIMLFIVLVSMIKMILEPEKANDKEAGVGSIVKRIIIVVVMLGLAPRLFELTYDIQKVILGQNKNNTNVIQNLILPYKIENNDNFGIALSLNLLESFYYVDKDNGLCDIYYNVLERNVLEKQDFTLGEACLNSKYDTEVDGQSVTKYEMHFDHIISVGVGIFMVYTLLMYCIKVGVRMIQLAFLQIISPMAFVSYLQPKKDTMFEKWKNMYISTYLDVFIRVAIISLVTLMISMILQKSFTLDGTTQTSQFWQSIENSTVGTTNLDANWANTMIMVIMVSALLQFGKRAPELLKEILPKGGPGSIGFGLGKKDNEGFFKALGFGRKTARFAAGVATGTAVGIIGGAVGGRGLGRATGALWEGLTGAVRGGSSGMKSKNITGAISDARKRQAQTNIARAQRIAAGQSLKEYIGDTIRGGIGMQSSYGKVSDDLAVIENALNAVDNSPSVSKVKQMRDEAVRDSQARRATAQIEMTNKLNALKEGLDKQKERLAHLKELSNTRSLSRAESAEYQKLKNMDFDSIEQTENQNILNAYNSQIAAIDKTIKNASDALNYMREATVAMNKGDTNTLEEMANNGQLQKIDGKYYVSGIAVNTIRSIKPSIDRASKAARTEFTSYKDMDDKANQLREQEAKNVNIKSK